MKTLKPKKIIGYVLLLFLLVSLLVVSVLKLEAGDLGCASLSNCSGRASCNGPGTSTGCEITCEDKSEIDCPEVE